MGVAVCIGMVILLALAITCAILRTAGVWPEDEDEK